MNLQYKSLMIRDAGSGDAQRLADWWNDGAVMAHAGFPKGLGTTAEKVKKDLQTDSDDTRRRLILEIDGETVGEMSCHNQGDGSAEIGIKICEVKWQEKGYGRQFLSMLIEELFRKGYQRIVLDTNLENKRAQHVYESLGFRKKNVRVNSWRDQLGQWQSAVDYELLPEDFVDFTKRS